MTVVACMPTRRGVTLSGEFGRPATTNRRWNIRVDSPETPLWAILIAPGVTFGQAHPELPGHLAMDFDLQEASGDGMAYALDWRYTIPPPENTPDMTTGLPRDHWGGSGGTKTIAVFKDKDGDVLTNSAGDPLEGAERESNEFTVTLTRCYADLSWSALAESAGNSVNAAAWNLGAARTWKVAFKGPSKRVMTAVANGSPVARAYWETVWEFAYRHETWDYQPWDVGYNQLVNDAGEPTGSGTKRAAILGSDKKPVRAPVALSGGVAKTPGSPPDALDIRLYPETDFSVFGTPG